MKSTTLFITMLSLAGLSASFPSQASYSWALTNGGSNSSSTYGNVRTYSGTGTPAPAPTLQGTAWSDTGSSNTLKNAYLASYGSYGLGVNNRIETTSVTTPDHAMDSNGSFDSILFNFSNSINLEKISIGWPSSTSSYDSDISVLAYTGQGTPVLANGTYSGLLSSGWTVIGNYCNVAQNVNATATINAGGQSSSYWLVAAYNSVFGTDCVDPSGKTVTCSSTTTNPDYVKISGLTGSVKTPPPPPGVPEPATLFLLGAGLLGLIRARRS
jgi:PEP-CTERM motif